LDSVEKVHRGLSAFELNTGTLHPLSALITAPALKKRQTGSSNGSDPLTDSNQILWFGTIEVGTPPTTYTVDFDTGSSDLFLPGPDCTTTCASHTVYDPTKSSTSNALGKTFSLAYGDGSTVSGQQYTDVVSISGLSVSNQTLGAASQYSTGFQSPNFPADGLLGMGFPSISVYGANPLFQSLVSSDAVPEPVFSFKLSNDSAELFVGGTDETLFEGDFTYVPVTQEGYWQVVLDSLTVGGQNVFSSNISVSSIIDTGTTLIVGDTQTVQAAYQSIKGATDNGDGTWSVPCDATPDVALGFGNQSFTVAPATFVLGAGAGATTCIGGLSYNDAIAGQFWIVGDVFLQNVYTAFDVGNSQVGFASLTGANATSTNTSTPTSSTAPATSTGVLSVVINAGGVVYDVIFPRRA